MKSLQKAVSDVAVSDALKVVQDLQSLSVIMLTRFVLYKQEISSEMIVDAAVRESWERLVQLQEHTFGGSAACKGIHFAVLGVLPSAVAGQLQLPSAGEINRAHRTKAMEFHEDKCYQVDRRKRRSVSAEEATRMMQAVNAAKGFLSCKSNLESFKNDVQRLFLQELQPLKDPRLSHVQMLIDEQRYGILNQILLDLRDVDKQLASRMGIPVEKMWKGIKNLLIQDVRRTQEAARANWEGSLFRELHEDLTKLSIAKRELAPHPDIVPNSIIEEARVKVENDIKHVGLVALACLERHSSLASAMTQIFQFGSHLIRLAHIFTHLKDFKVQAENEVTHALNVCQDKHWGANFLIELGMKLSLGKIGDPKTDATVARIIASEFPHFESVRTAVFNRETRVTQRDVGETLKVS